MAGGTLVRVSPMPLRDLFGGGTAVGIGDAELLRRYAGSRDESAFAALVARHGPMVAATCRAVLRDHHDAEDAFQAAFLVLARKAGSVRAGEALGGWLHRVAYRAAVQRKIEIERRRRTEAALCDAGFAILHRREIQGQAELRLQPWARVSGTVMMDGKPANGLSIQSADSNRSSPVPGEPRIHIRYEIKTDAKGRFDLRRVMPGRLERFTFASHTHVGAGSVCPATG